MLYCCSNLPCHSGHKFGCDVDIPWVGIRILYPMTLQELITWVISIAVSGVYFKTKNWLLSNILGVAFSVYAIENISIGSFEISTILLCGLFFYDIFWVFATDMILTGDSVMVTVAKSLDAPIKLLFPKNAKPDFSMLGLGDIVIPGMFVALLLRFDAERANVKNYTETRFPKPYFHAGIVAYALGLCLTVMVMEYFKAAQPALLYLVPACLLSAMLMATVRKEFKALWAYDEEAPNLEHKDCNPEEKAGPSTADSTATAVESKKTS
uniref:Signal peptide peptidase n=1 Tax=Octactis speculum TaxID=3111310 RepID=A0A7S2GVW1_9STRA|mmetsp:Transcript_58571/g.79863  ORF Transcript_58571/g.79863 Transcript_58571/m.79863 type:complete len:267 (+) Transcript_58571:417-1217(+)